MKKKNTIALVIGIACVMILTIAMIWNAFDNSKPPEKEPSDTPVVDQNNQIGDEANPSTDPQQPDSSQSGDNDEPTVPEDDEKMPAPDKDDESSDVDKEEKPSVSEKDDTTVDANPSVQPDSNVDKMNPNPTTAEEIKAVLNDPFMILVNRERKVSSDYVGSDLVTFADPYKLNKTCADALRQLMNAGRKAGYSYTLYSGYRSYSSQYNKYYNKINSYKNNGKSEDEAIRLTNQYYAPPGASEHHTGLAADVCIPAIVNKYACLHENYDQTPEFTWFSSHAHEYGFILRYPKGDEAITGYNYEPWHYRYVGVEIASEIYRRGITLEEYVEELEGRLEKLEA